MFSFPLGFYSYFPLWQNIVLEVQAIVDGFPPDALFKEEKQYTIVSQSPGKVKLS